MVSFGDFRVLLLVGISLVCQEHHSSLTVSGFVSITRKNVAMGRRELCKKSPRPQTFQRHHSKLSMIGTGFSFEDGEQILVSVQKPMGMVLEQDDNDSDSKIVVTELDPTASAARAGVQVGDVLVAVQNAAVMQQDLDSVLDFIQKGPRVMNLRFQRR
mmetsp:Transcript_13179/g.31576  ORF Transcript_13179/g.31576 Transcript_13179/m.31576 type:complete len:158 (-) Transcript_13179:4516-4989(-)